MLLNTVTNAQLLNACTFSSYRPTAMLPRFSSLSQPPSWRFCL